MTHSGFMKAAVWSGAVVGAFFGVLMAFELKTLHDHGDSYSTPTFWTYLGTVLIPTVLGAALAALLVLCVRGARRAVHRR
jgi:hypothetical protein